MTEKKKRDSHFIRFLGWFFGSCADLITSYAWLFILGAIALTVLGAVKIPLTRITNKITDFTPLNSPSYTEYYAFSSFFDEASRPNSINMFITAKDGGSMLTAQRMQETVEVLDNVRGNFMLKTPDGPVAFKDFCKAFCDINEPVRTFANGLNMVSKQKKHGNNTLTLDLSYPDTTVLNVPFHIDTNVFGAKIAVERNGETVEVSPSEALELNEGKQLRNNLRSIQLIVLIFKSEIPNSISAADVDDWEGSIVQYYTKEFKSSEIDVRIYADSFLTTEIVRTGRTLVPFIAIGYVIMIAFSAGTFCISALALGQMSYDKIFLAVMASTTPLMACAAALGMMFWCGIRYGNILCITPFLVLAIGVDDAYLMVNGWQQITASRIKKEKRSRDLEEELRIRMRETLRETGPSIAITTITNACAFAISAIRGSPEIQLFSVGNALAILVAFTFQLILYGSIMVLTGRREIRREFEAAVIQASQMRKTRSFPGLDSEEWAAKKQQGAAVLHRILHSYCVFITRWPVSILILIMLGGYLSVSVLYGSRVEPDMKPDRFFLPDSPFTKLFEDRQEHLIPHYSVAWISVQNPGDIFDPHRRAEIENMVEDFESLPSSVGHYSTKFFLREFETFTQKFPELLPTDEGSSNDTQSGLSSKYDQLQNFLAWEENAYWRGFIQFENENEDNGSQPHATRFMFVTAYKGQELKIWANRVVLLKEWREVAARYPSLNVSVFQEDSMFLDVIDTLAVQATQSAMWTIASMFIVTILFIPQPIVLFTATFSIISTCLGVLGLMTLMGFDLDPMFASSLVMCIGFSVDIPAHIAYHFYHTGTRGSDIVDRLHHTIARVGFPIMQASLSTILCISSLYFINLHMSRVFATTILMVVSLGTIHGLIIMPVIFGVSSFFSRKTVAPITPPSSNSNQSERSVTVLAIS